MKRLFLISASLMLTYAAIAQSDNALFRFRDGEEPRSVSRLGTAPEFPFLRNKSSANEVYRTIKRHENDNTEAMNNLNGLLMQIGYANGAKDLEASDISMEYIAPGTVGNMGSSGYTYALYRLDGDPEEFKAWKIAANDGNNMGALYLFAKCGNAFFPRTGGRTACIMVPVDVKPDMNQISLPASGSKITTDNKTFVYYSRKRHKKDDQAYPVAGLNEEYPSEPLQVVMTKDMDIRPEIYTVSLNNNRLDVSACENQTLALTANVNVEKTATYTGNYPAKDNTTYLKVSKRHYKMIARKMHNAERKANKVAHRTGQQVVVTRDANKVVE
ncbi:hypothetical protein GCM10023093_14820 [Nemorincola caseinilytica]|uniref:Uncharacterized protein n=1 Tax=Nemorincola caseinilytica TaxID=2054315 RepID=A0ABP8NBC0_9BACT